MGWEKTFGAMIGLGAELAAEEFVHQVKDACKSGPATFPQAVADAGGQVLRPGQGRLSIRYSGRLWAVEAVQAPREVTLTFHTDYQFRGTPPADLLDALLRRNSAAARWVIVESGGVQTIKCVAAVATADLCGETLKAAALKLVAEAVETLDEIS